MDAIQYLLNDHRLIMAQVADLRRAAQDLAARGEAAVPQARPVLERIGRMMETELALHARKEDDCFFPALEAIFGAEGTPTAVMRQEHKDIHAQGQLLRQTLHELNEVEHPAIEAGGAQLRALAAQGASAASLLDVSEEIIRLLDMHFGKEEQVLFPMAESLLDEAQRAQCGAAMERLELEG
jgi:iron-sulfur cluster repair protein YtfE (RIC family)